MTILNLEQYAEARKLDHPDETPSEVEHAYAGYCECMGECNHYDY